MRTHNLLPCYRRNKEILIMQPDLALLSTLIGSNYPCLELIFIVPKVFEPLKFDCIFLFLIVYGLYFSILSEAFESFRILGERKHENFK